MSVHAVFLGTGRNARQPSRARPVHVAAALGCVPPAGAHRSVHRIRSSGRSTSSKYVIVSAVPVAAPDDGASVTSVQTSIAAQQTVTL